VSKLLGHGRKKGWLTQRIDLPWQPETKGRIRVLSVEEEQRLLQEMPFDIQQFCILGRRDRLPSRRASAHSPRGPHESQLARTSEDEGR
jgi:hypothetical protein